MVIYQFDSVGGHIVPEWRDVGKQPAVVRLYGRAVNVPGIIYTLRLTRSNTCIVIKKEMSRSLLIETV